MAEFPSDIFTEPEPDPDTLANLGPLAALAGVWEGTSGRDVHPHEDGSEEDVYVERYEAQPIDAQTNGPQLLYGLRYHTHIRRPGEVETFHDQVGYWLWEPATGTIHLTIAIPRGQVAMATGTAAPDSTEFTVAAEVGCTSNGILTNPFLDHAFHTTRFTMKVTVHDDGSWSYWQNTELQVRGREGTFDHVDEHRLHRVAAPTPNPTALAAAVTEAS
jgi:hypothetical protein